MKNKLFWTTALVAVLLVTTRKVLYGGISAGTIISAVIGAILLSLLFHVVGLKLLRKTGQRLVPPIDLRANESVVLQAEANYLRRLKTLGGRLTLTNERLVFHADKLNTYTEEEVIYVNEVEGVSPGDGTNEKILQIKVRNNDVYRFVVDSPSRWARALLGVMGGD